MSETTDDMDALLNEAADKGALDSVGSFTVDKAAAFAKLGAFQLPRPAAWILKVVQAAVSSKAAELTITQRRTATLFCFEPKKEFSLERVLTLDGPEQTRAVHHLGVALRALKAIHRPFRLSYQGTRLSWDGETLSERTTSDQDASLFLEVRSDDNDTSWWPLRKRRLAAAEYLELTCYAAVCPIPLTCDGRRLDTMDPAPSDVEGSRALLCLGWSPPVEGSGIPSLGLPQGIRTPGWRPTDRLTDERVFMIDGSRSQVWVQNLARLSYHYALKHDARGVIEFKRSHARSQVHWVRDGVVCYVQPLLCPASSVRLELFISAQGLESDLTGLAVKSSSESVLRLTHCLKAAIELLSHTAQELSTYKPVPHPSEIFFHVVTGVVLSPLLIWGKTFRREFMNIETEKSTMLQGCLEDLLVFAQELEKERATRARYPLES